MPRQKFQVYNRLGDQLIPVAIGLRSSNGRTKMPLGISLHLGLLISSEGRIGIPFNPGLERKNQVCPSYLIIVHYTSRGTLSTRLFLQIETLVLSSSKSFVEPTTPPLCTLSP